MKTIKAYYAHPMSLYRSDTEKRDLAILRGFGFGVVNPADTKYSKLQMSDFVDLATSCDLVAFRAFEDGKVGSGVGLEIKAATEAGIPVIEIGAPLSDRLLSRNETRERMGLTPLRHPDTAPIRTVIERLTDKDAEYADADWGNS